MLRKAESGQTLILALALLVVGGLLVLPVLTNTFTNLNYNQTIECRTLNDYSADAGLQYVICKIYNSPGAYTTTPLSENFTLNGRTVNVNAGYGGGGLFSINSTASGGRCGRTTIRSFVSLSHGAFAYALAAKGDLIIDNASVDTFPDPDVGAPVHSNNNIVITQPKKSGNKIWGDASAVGTIEGQEHVADGYEIEEYSDNLTFPNTNDELYKTIAQEGGTWEGDYTVSGTEELGPLYITGSLIVDAWNTVILEGPLYILGNVEVSSWASINGNEHILCEGDVIMQGGIYVGSEFIPVITSLYGNISLEGPGFAETVLYAPNGNLLLDNVTLFGAAGGMQVTARASGIWYSEQLHGRADLPGSELYPLTYSYD